MILLNSGYWMIPNPVALKGDAQPHKLHLPPNGMATLADLYDPLTMPAALAKAHAELDRAVERCYRPEPFRSDRERVEHLFRLYEQLTAPLLPVSPRRRGGGRSPAGTSRPRTGRGRTPGLPASESPP